MRLKIVEVVFYVFQKEARASKKWTGFAEWGGENLVSTR